MRPRPPIYDGVNHWWNNRPNRPFRPGWWYGGRPHPHWHPWYRPGGYSSWYWWGGCSVAALTGWIVGTSWQQPIYYDYGAGGNVYYENNVVYVDGSPYTSADVYYQQAQTIAQAVPEYSEPQSESLEWMPLGVWAVTQEGAESSPMVLQLAVNKDGVIAGTYYNETTKTTIPLEGSVSQETQRAAWHPVDGTNDHIVFETGVFNLTEDTTTALVHFGPDKTQEITLVRIEAPEGEAAGNP